MPTLDTGNETLGRSIPADTPHAVSVSLPTWRANVGYEEGESWVVDSMTTGYPRFFVHRSIQRLADIIVNRFGRPNEAAILFPSYACAFRATTYFNRHVDKSAGEVRILQFAPDPHHDLYKTLSVMPALAAVLYPKSSRTIAKEIWQHTGEGVSSRRSEYCETCLVNGVLVEKSALSALAHAKKGPKRYQRNLSIDKNNPASNDSDNDASTRFVEERYGRNLDIAAAKQAKTAVRERIAGLLPPTERPADAASNFNEIVEHGRNGTSNCPDTLSRDDVYLFSGGMNAIYTAQRVLNIDQSPLKCIMFGFPYIDTLKILEKWGPGAAFFGDGREKDLDELEQRLKNGERFLALFCEFPGNPLLKTPNLQRIRALADQYDFAVVIDETIGNFLNVYVMPYADIVVSSLTKVFSGESNVMAGCAVLNPRGRRYEKLKSVMEMEYEDNFFEEDAVFLERNSRDSVSRVARINENAEAICDILLAHPRVKNVNYPKHNDTRANYDACRIPTGGYGGLLSVTFASVKHSTAFFDNLDTAKGPSLGTNFTLSSPYVLLAHYTELEWAAQFGVEDNLVRVSVGLEDPEELKAIFKRALDAIPE